jgi:hypothetical protein
MGIHSPFGDFFKILCEIQEKALLFQGRLSKSEASTRVVLIDPVLKALGWDTSNPTMIEFEKTLPPQSRVDYALYSQEGKIQVIIEAKALGVNLGDKTFIFNLIMYAIAAGIKDIFLTDGIIWEHYSDFAPGNVISSKTIDLTKDNLVECAAYLINELDAAKFWQGTRSSDNGVNEQLAKEILGLRSEISNLKQILSTLNQSVPVEIITSPIAEKHDSKGRFVELSSLPQKLTGQKPPVMIRLPDGSTKRVSKWRDILLECCHFVLSQNQTITIPLSDAAGKKVKLLDTNPPSEGIAQHKVNYCGRDIFIYANYDAGHCVKNAIHIMKLLSPNKSKVDVQFVEEL